MTSHGLPEYRKGCRCAECRDAKSQYSKESRRVRISQTAFKDIPHGLKGYYSYACRCYDCKYAMSESTKTRRSSGRTDAPHGTVNGYTNYSCRCDSCREAYRSAKRARDLKNRYGLTPSEFLAMRESQRGVCAICGRDFTSHPGSVDHDHRTGKVRGILCIACNSGLGAIQDDINRISQLVKYLDRTGKLE